LGGSCETFGGIWEEIKESSEVILIKKPNACTEFELQDFATFVCAGDEVAVDGLTERIKKAEVLVFLSQEGSLKGIAALKNPEQGYKKEVFQKAQATAKES
jgi:hypothetical protein